MQGKQIGEKYNGVYIDFQKVVNGIAGIVINDKLGVTDKTGNIILEPVYDEIYCLMEDNSFVVKKDNKWNWLDSEGKLIYENFDDFGYQLKKHLLVLQNDNWFYVGNNGNVFKE